MYLSTILKQLARWKQSAMMFKSASLAKNGFAIVTANMFQDTTTNMFVDNQIAQLHAHLTKISS
ncbi:MAG: hypothetical protein BGO14_02865 [Chlamydiales bacterium 38-26]|nr:MAG: hypothetical protein BGO14_02865 [Chlamydiales bacterium 38-26]